MLEFNVFDDDRQQILEIALFMSMTPNQLNENVGGGLIRVAKKAGLNIKAGRAFWTLGYLNEHHAHADDFADRPLPYRAYLNKAFNLTKTDRFNSAILESLEQYPDSIFYRIFAIICVSVASFLRACIMIGA